MYYVIKKQPENPVDTFVGFSVRKYIVNRNNNSVIFEFLKSEKIVRKWIKRDEIILLTKDKKYFLKIMTQFKKTQTMQQKLVNEAHALFENAKYVMTETINAEINEFEEIKDSEGVPCILKDI